MDSRLKGMFFYEVETCGSPLVDIYETEDELVCELDLPGLEPEAISVRVFEDILVVQGVSADTPCRQGLSYLCMERGSGDFRRVVKLPVSVNGMAAAATYALGVVTVRFPKLKGKVFDIPVRRATECVTPDKGLRGGKQGGQ